LNEERVNIFSSSKKPLKLGLMHAFISNKNNNDTLVALKDVILFMQTANCKWFVFDNQI
jgi:phosphate transport system substrate-binding protein